MTTPARSRSAEDSDESCRSPSGADKIGLWQHFVRTAGEDKNKMITISMGLLTLSAGMLGSVLTNAVAPENRFVLSALGVLVSLFALYIVWLYSAHEKWNRRKAENLVEQEPALKALLPPGDRPKGGAWVFGFFLVLTLCSLIAHIIVGRWA